MKTVIDRLHDLFGKRVQFILKREVVEEKVFDDELENYVPWKPDERFVLDRAIAETSIFSDEFCSEYGDKLREMLTDHIDSQVPFSLTVRFENEKSLLNFIPVENFQGRTVGWLFSLNSHDSLEREIDRFILISVVFFVLTVILVLFSLYYFSTQKRIETMAIYDSLTGCYSRIVVMDRLRGEDDRFQRYETPYSMIMLDIDKFKSVNDQFGHLTGDEVIKSIVWLAGNHIRKSDILGRYGGEEFIVVLPHTPRESAVEVAEKLRLKIAEYSFPLVGSVTVSCGVSGRSAEHDSVEDVIREADENLYKAKESGRNRVVS